MTFEKKFNRVKKILVGLWRFRDPDKGLLWAGTWTHRAVFYDTWPQKTPEDALEIVYNDWHALKTGKRRTKIRRG